MKSNIKGPNSNNNRSSKSSKRGRVLPSSNNHPLPVYLSAIERAISNEIKKLGTVNLECLSALTEKAILDLDELQLSKKTLSLCRKKIISVMETKFQSALNSQYTTFLEKPDVTELEALAIISKPSYISEILENPNYPNYVKDIVRNSIPQFLKTKLEELETTPEEFEEYVKDPSAQRMITKLTEPVSDSIIEDPEEHEQPAPVPVIPQKNIKYIKVRKAKAKKEIKPTTAVPTKSSKTSFFEQVKLFTNNFRFLIQSTQSEMSDQHMGKFNDFESYMKFKTFQTYLGRYMETSQKSELEAITHLISKKPEELAEIDPGFIEILEKRKEVIEKEQVR